MFKKIRKKIKKNEVRCFSKKSGGRGETKWVVENVDKKELLENQAIENAARELYDKKFKRKKYI